jgi:sulfonate transport system substrate-binding protein
MLVTESEPADVGGTRDVDQETGHEPAKYADLRVLGPTSAPAFAPVRLAVTGLYPGLVTLGEGGVEALCGERPSADLVVGSETELLRVSLSERCTDLRVLFTVSEGLHRIVAKRSSGIESLADLADKHVLVMRGSPSHRFLSEMAARVDLTLGDEPGQIHPVFGAGDGNAFELSPAPDAVAIREPAAEQAAESLGQDAVSLELDGSGNRAYRELVNLHASALSLEDPAKRRGIARFVKALSEASIAIGRDEAAAIPLLLEATGVNAAVLAKSLEHQRFAGTLVGDVHGVLEDGEAWQAGLEGRGARGPEELSKLVDWGVYLTALWPEQAWD